jgi:hypothetical protein
MANRSEAAIPYLNGRDPSSQDGLAWTCLHNQSSRVHHVVHCHRVLFNSNITVVGHNRFANVTKPYFSYTPPAP